MEMEIKEEDTTINEEHSPLIQQPEQASTTNEAALADILATNEIKEETETDSKQVDTPLAVDESPIDDEKDGDVGEGLTGDGGNNIGRWTSTEHNQFLKGLELFGKDWRKISSVVPTRTLIQIRTHAQKFFQKTDFGMKYDRAGDESEKKHIVVKKKIVRPVHTNYQAPLRQSQTRPNHTIMTRSRTPSPTPDELMDPSREEKLADSKDTLPEFEIPDEKSSCPKLSIVPHHYRRTLRPSSMPLSSEDLFSRRITPHGVYYSEDRVKQERQFATAVLDLLSKGAYEEEKPVEKPPVVVQTTMEAPAKKERRVSIIEPPKTVAAKPFLHIKNPDSLLTLKDEEDYRADLNAPKTPANVRGNRSLLHKAVMTSELETKKFIDNQEENMTAIEYYLNQTDSHGFTPLMTAVCLNDSVAAMNITSLLVEHGARLDSRDREGNTALLWSATVGHPSIMRYLIEKGGHLNEQNDEGETALHCALRENREECACILIKEAKVDISIRNSMKQTALDVLNSRYCKLDTEAKLRIRETFYVCHPSLRTIIVHHPDCNLHLPRMNGSQGTNPWEAPPRIDAILSLLHANFKDWQVVYDTSFPIASDEAVLRAHSRRYLELIRDLIKKVDQDQSIAFTPHVQQGFGVPTDKLKDDGICDTSFSKGSLQAALRAAGGAIHGIDKVVSGEFRNAFICVRPPGHHAGIDGLLTTASSCGFCIFNNVMIGALYALEKYPEIIKRIAIVDIDIHHGNGTEQIVRKYNHPEKILFWSSHIYYYDPHHEYEFYPGTGKDDFVYNNVYNNPLQPLWETEQRHDVEGGRVHFRRVIKERLLPCLRAFLPDLIILSSGFDGGHNDVGNYRHIPTTSIGMNLKPEDFAWVLNEVNEVASMCCEGRVVSMLEGGYGNYEKRKSDGEIILARESLARNVGGHLHGLLNEYYEEKEKPKKAPERYCGCGEIREEEMIECACGKKCGGWVHFSCAGIDYDTYGYDDKEPFICKWCRADGFELGEGRKPEKTPVPNAEESPRAEEDDGRIVTRNRTRGKKDTDGTYYGGYRRDHSDDEGEGKRRKKRARYSGYGSAKKEDMVIDDDFN